MIGSTSADDAPGSEPEPPAVDIVLQPIIDAATGDVFAYEALARFANDESAETVLARTRSLERRIELELLCVRAAVARLPDLPAGVLLSINISPDALHVAAAQEQVYSRLEGLIVEVTEHAAGHPESLERDVAGLRARGALIAVDDVGTGYAGLLRLASLRPDIVKLDRSIVTGVARSVTQAAVLESLVALSHRIGSSVIAEGVESAEDLAALARFDVDYAQGWFVGRPGRAAAPIDLTVIRACRLSRAGVLAPVSAPVGPDAGVRSMYEVTSLLGLATEFAHLNDAVVAAAAALSVDVVGLSMLDPEGYLRELVCSGKHLDAHPYALADYPVSYGAIRTGSPAEVHLNDTEGDPDEQRVMRRIGCRSLLIVPVGASGRPVGILEFFQRTHRRWTTLDVAQGHGLALHVSTTLQRLSQTTISSSA